MSRHPERLDEALQELQVGVGGQAHRDGLVQGRERDDLAAFCDHRARHFDWVGLQRRYRRCHWRHRNPDLGGLLWHCLCSLRQPEHWGLPLHGTSARLCQNPLQVVCGQLWQSRLSIVLRLDGNLARDLADRGRRGRGLGAHEVLRPVHGGDSCPDGVHGLRRQRLRGAHSGNHANLRPLLCMPLHGDLLGQFRPVEGEQEQVHHQDHEAADHRPGARAEHRPAYGAVVLRA
mmetsp:Transcript_1946/g.6519  ORF Transcript_1946/g.6519 Transcript_1946/m.6519 type:complete len:232 (-) Transcript_1946:2810-3505(-)